MSTTVGASPTTSSTISSPWSSTAPSVGPNSAQKLFGVVVTLIDPSWQTCGMTFTSVVEVAKMRTPETCRVRSKSEPVPKTPTKTGSVTGVEATTRVFDVGRGSGCVVTQPITATSRTAAPAYA